MGFLREEQRDLIRSLYPDRADDYNLLLAEFGNFAEREILPHAAEIDRHKMFPRENMQKLWQQGLTAMPYPPEYGGLGLPYPVYVAALELVAKACASTALSIGIHGTVCDGIYRFGSAELKERYLKPLLTGQKMGAFALTEPGSGSDARAMRSKVVEEGDYFVLTGSKMFITNAGEADVYFVFARHGESHSALLLDKETLGFTTGGNIDKLGLRGSRLMALNFDGCKIPKASLVGRAGEGFEYAKHMLYGGRLTIAAQAIGIAQLALDRTLRYTRQRTQFGQPLSEFQITQEKLATLYTEVNAARLLTYYAASRKERGLDYESEAAQAKVFASEMALHVCNEAIQLHGGYGYTDEFDIHRHWRDAKLMTIGEGANEILKLVIARRLLEA